MAAEGSIPGAAQFFPVCPQGVHSLSPAMLRQKIQNSVAPAAPGDPAVSQLTRQDDPYSMSPGFFVDSPHPVKIGRRVKGMTEHVESVKNRLERGYVRCPYGDMLDIAILFGYAVGKRPFIG